MIVTVNQMSNYFLIRQIVKDHKSSSTLQIFSIMCVQLELAICTHRLIDLSIKLARFLDIY